MPKMTIMYMRVSTGKQSHKSQQPDLQRWLDGQNPDDIGKVVWLTDKSTGRNTDRPGFQTMMDHCSRGEVGRIVVWRLDRISRSVQDLCKLIEILKARKVNLISLRENIDLKSASGRLLVNILASIAEFESELKSERILAGQAVARENGVKWGGSKAGRLAGLSPEQAKTILKLKSEGLKPGKIAKAVNVHRSTIYRILKRHEEGLLQI